MATVGGEHLQGSVTILQTPTNPTLPRSFTTSQSRETLLAHGDGQKQAGICRGLQVQDRQPELRSMAAEAPPKAQRQQPWHLACDHLAETMYSSDCPWEAGGPSTGQDSGRHQQDRCMFFLAHQGWNCDSTLVGLAPQSCLPAPLRTQSEN